ncbi:MAG: MarR family winged helix-turn-helix transcriptional regulator [Rhizobiaceae bacterium]|nr:MarR family winged helix-turn-helix transcriptional regulator [Rhizobiaceae bacterium]
MKKKSNSSLKTPRPDKEIHAAPISADDVSQLQNITLLFFAYRDFIGEADRKLKEIGFGRAHHRVLFFVCRKPGLTVAQLLDILGITKQSLARVLRQMVSKGYVVQKTGPSDRRQRLLFPTQSGRDLVLVLSRMQSDRIKHALKISGIRNDAQLSQFLDAMIDPKERERINFMMPSPQEDKTGMNND